MTRGVAIAAGTRCAGEDCGLPMVPGDTRQPPEGHVAHGARGLCRRCYNRAKYAEQMAAPQLRPRHLPTEPCRRRATDMWPGRP